MQVTHVGLFSIRENIFHRHLTMEFAISPDIFQPKMNYLFHGYEFIYSYIYNLLVFKKGDWTEYLQKLELTRNKLNIEILKYNIDKFSF